MTTDDVQYISCCSFPPSLVPPCLTACKLLTAGRPRMTHACRSPRVEGSDPYSRARWTRPIDRRGPAGRRRCRCRCPLRRCGFAFARYALPKIGLSLIDEARQLDMQALQQRRVCMRPYVHGAPPPGLTIGSFCLELHAPRTCRRILAFCSLAWPAGPCIYDIRAVYGRVW